jgi:hypothetical protein
VLPVVVGVGVLATGESLELPLQPASATTHTNIAQSIKLLTFFSMILPPFN